MFLRGLPRLLLSQALLITAIGGQGTEKRKEYEDCLRAILGRKINPLIPPFVDDGKDGGLVPVEVDFQLHRIIDLKSASATLKVSGKIRVSWTDARLAWGNASGPGSVLVPAAAVWMPEVALWTSADFGLGGAAPVLVQRGGRAVVERTVQVDVACQVSVRYFPRDVQHCRLVFLPPLSHRGVVRMAKDPRAGPDHAAAIGEEWRLLGCRRAVAPQPLVDAAGRRVQVAAFEVGLLLQRNSAFYFLTLILPTIMLALVTLVPFVLPPALVEAKIGVPITAYLSFNIYMLLIEKSLPKTAEAPVLGQAVAVFMAMCIFTEAMQAVSIKFYSCHLRRVPRLLAVLYFRVLAVLCCYRTCHGSADLELREEDAGEGGPGDKKAAIKMWNTMGRINDRIGLVTSGMLGGIAFLYLFGSCYSPPDIPPSFRERPGPPR